MPATAAARRREVTEVTDEIYTAENAGTHFNDSSTDRAVAERTSRRPRPSGRGRHKHFRGSVADARHARARFAGAHRQAPARETGLIEFPETSTLAEQQGDTLVVHHVATPEADFAAARHKAPLEMDEVIVEAALRRRRARARHRQFRLNGAQMLIGVTLMGQLTMVLWLQSQALSLRNHDHKLREKIAQTNELIAQTKNDISQLDSETNLGRLASQMKWDKAPMTSFDKITDKRRLTPQEAAALSAPAGAKTGERSTTNEER